MELIKSYWIKVGFKPNMTDVLVRRGHSYEKRREHEDRERRSCDDGGRGYKPRNTQDYSHHQTLRERGGMDSSPSALSLQKKPTLPIP